MHLGSTTGKMVAARDVHVFPLLTCVLALAAALLAPHKLALWAMAGLMCLHMATRMRSTPLLITVLSTSVFRTSAIYWSADLNMAAAAYVFFYIAYENQVATSVLLTPAKRTDRRDCVQNPMSPRASGASPTA